MSQDGGQDNGGGNLAESTIEEVEHAIKQSLRVAYDCDSINFIYSTFDGNTEIQANDELKEIVGRVIFPGGNLAKNPKPAHRQYARLCNYLPLSKIILNRSDSCATSDNAHADASVSAHQVGADLCLSVANLKRVPPHHLFGEVLSLIIHEAAHLVGLRENEAIALQKAYASRLVKMKLYFDKAALYKIYSTQIADAKKVVAEGRIESRGSYALQNSLESAEILFSDKLPDYEDPYIFGLAVAHDFPAYRTKVAPTLFELRNATGKLLKELNDPNKSQLHIEADPYDSVTELLKHQKYQASVEIRVGKILDLLDEAQAGVEEAFGPAQKQ